MMRTGIFSGADINYVSDVISCARDAAAAGIRSIWYPQVNSIDIMTALAAAVREVPDIRFGTAVVPIQGRHPIPLAQQALTVADAAGDGRFTLGVGVSHPPTSEGWYGIPYRGIVDLCAEVLPPLASLLEQRRADYTGSRVTARVQLTSVGPSPRLLVAALGPRMLDLAGRHAHGTVTWMTGLSSIQRHVLPRIRRAAAEAGRPCPEVVVGLPLCVTDDPSRVREDLRPTFERMIKHPSYRRAIATEGVNDPLDIALVGSLQEVEARLAAFSASGVDEFIGILRGSPEEQKRTCELLSRTYGG